MFDKSSHYPLLNIKWDEEKVQQTICKIADDAISCFDYESGLPCHPLDESFGNNMYMGTAGVLWGINYLQQAGVIANNFDIKPFLINQLNSNREEFKKSPHPKNSSYLFGELPILMLQYKLFQSNMIKNDILLSIKKNNTQPIRELMWGTAGTMLASHFMHQWTSEPKWKDIYILQAKRLLADWKKIPNIGYLWSVQLYGGSRKYLGPVHGFIGNIIPLIKGQKYFSKKEFEEICIKVMETVINTAISDQDYANWDTIYTKSNPNNIPKRVQYCHGAPGIVATLSELPKSKNKQFDEILEKGGELIWLAGPLKKGSNLCHGTGGNGYAFLKLYERTKNELWLERARSFAMYSIKQYKLAKTKYRQGRYTLWTGDIGLAIYLWDCIQSKAKFPTIDVF